MSRLFYNFHFLRFSEKLNYTFQLPSRSFPIQKICFCSFKSDIVSHNYFMQDKWKVMARYYGKYWSQSHWSFDLDKNKVGLGVRTRYVTLKYLYHSPFNLFSCLEVRSRWFINSHRLGSNTTQRWKDQVVSSVF